MDNENYEIPEGEDISTPEGNETLETPEKDGDVETRYISKELFQRFTGKFYEDDSDISDEFIDSAIEHVSSYLGYDPVKRSYSISLRGDGTDILSLPAPIITVESVDVDGTSLPVESLEFHKNHLFCYKGYERYIYPKGAPIKVTFTGGYPNVPKPIVVATLQIASLLSESMNGNLSVTSVAYGNNEGSRTFTSWKISKFLEEIGEYRIYFRDN